MREDYVSISPAQLRAVGQQNVDYMLDRPPFTRYFWTGRGFEPVSGANTLYTAAQLSALAAAGGLTPFATYIASDTGARSFATDASTLTADPPGAAAGTVGTGTVSAPALVVSTGFSTAVAAAMEALSAALPKDAQYSTPTVAEQGVIELGNGTWTLEKTINLDLSGASVSRYGLTIRGQGRGSTILKTATTAPVANFRGGDGIWRMMSFVNGAGMNSNHLRLQGFALVSYATQGADGTTNLTDPARWLDMRSCLLASLRDLRVYHRSPGLLSLNQYGVALEDCYYARLDDVLCSFFTTPDTKANAAGTLKARRGGVAFRFQDNNALTGTGLNALGGNLAFHIIDEDGLTLHGGAVEDVNKGFLFDGNSNSCRVLAMRHETNLTTLAMEAAGEMYFARFGENTSRNYIEQFSVMPFPGGSVQDYSADQSNRVFVPRAIKRRDTTNLLAGKSWTNGAGYTTAAGADWPSHLDPSITGSTQVTASGSYGQTRYSDPITVNPDWGSVRYRCLVKRLSGAGFLSPMLQSKGGGANTPVFGSRPNDPARVWTINAAVPVTSVAWSGGKLTVVCAREHGLQAGMRARNSAAWGTLAINSEMYVESMPDASTLVLIAAAGGTIADPGTVSSPAAITVMSDMIPWSFCPDISADWREFASNVSIRMFVATAPSLDGSNKAIIPIGSSNVLGLQTGSKIKLSGFADSRLNDLTYTVLAGDVSGANLTLSGAAAMAGLVTTATSKGQTVTSYGYIGLTEIVADIRTVTTNTGQPIVWEIAGETLIPGYSDEL